MIIEYSADDVEIALDYDGAVQLKFEPPVCEWLVPGTDPDDPLTGAAACLYSCLE